MHDPYPVIIIGGGISGLTTASVLKKRDISFLLLEAKDCLGGAIHTVTHEGYLCETGPNTLMLSNPKVIDFLNEMHLLESALDAAPHAKKRFIVKNNQLLALPNSPINFLKNPILSWSSKLQLLKEPFLSKGKTLDETLAQFVRRRLGQEMLDEFVGPFVSGVYAGNPEQLILRHAFPKLYRLEQTYGSLLIGAFCKRSGPAPKARLISWAQGLSELIQKLSDPFKNQILLSTPVHKITHQQTHWRIDSTNATFSAKQIIFATSIDQTAQLLRSFYSITEPLEKIPYAPITVIHLGFSKESIDHPLDGFGVLISRKRSIRTLGALFSSTLFPKRAPKDHTLLTCFIGGTFDPHVHQLTDSCLVQTVLKDLSPLLQIKSPPHFLNITRWPQAIPQYDSTHTQLLETCETIEKNFPSLHLLGNYRGGISLEACLLNGLTLGENFKHH